MAKCESSLTWVRVQVQVRVLPHQGLVEPPPGQVVALVQRRLQEVRGAVACGEVGEAKEGGEEGGEMEPSWRREESPFSRSMLTSVS